MSNFVLKKYKEFYEEHGYILPYSIRTTVRRLKILHPVLLPTVVAQVVAQPF